MRRKGIQDEGAPGAKNIPGSAVAAPLAVLVIIALLSSVTAREWMASGVTALVGAVLYSASRARWLRKAARVP